MAEVKISALSSATTPLAGTEVVPIVQGGVTKKVAVSNLGGGGSAVWGGITGTLSSQTDLQTALNAKQATLTSGTNIKTINGVSVLGSGDLTVGGASAWLESNATDLTIWNNGQGNIATNTSFGDGALKVNTTGTQNTAIGVGALSANTATSNSTAVGYNALRVSTGGSNVAIGTNALGSNTTAVDNVAVGNGALISNTTGTNNTAIGNTALASNISGTLNTAVGYGALLFNDDTSNTAIGYNALRVSTTGVVNTAIGYNAAPAHTTGIRNVFIGGNSGAFNTTGNNNTVIGNDTSTGNFSSCTILGRGATATANNQFVVGSAGVNAGTVTTETLSSTKTWSVIINGVAQKILLA